jgi:hypothetical protein
MFLTLLISFGYCQRVGTKEPLFALENYSQISGDGMVTFEIDCRMPETIETVELNDIKKKKKNERNFFDKLDDWWWFKVRKIYNFEIAKTYTFKPANENYYLKDLGDDYEHIYMKCNLIPLKSLFVRNNRKQIEIILYNIAGKIIYNRKFTLDKNSLIKDYTNVKKNL